PELARSYRVMCEHFRLGDTVKITERLDPLLGMEVHYMGLNEEQRELLFNELVRQIEEEPFTPRFPYLYCAFCDRCLFSARQIFMHLASSEHNMKSTNANEHYAEVNTVLTMLVGGWRIEKLLEEEAKQVRIQREKWASIPLGEVRSPMMPMLPTGFRLADNLREKYEYGSKFVNYEVFELIERRLVGDDKCGEKTMRKLNEWIGNAKTRCLWCRLIFINAMEYFDHLLTYFHIRNTETFDINTIVVNIQRHTIARLQPWPQLHSFLASAVATHEVNQVELDAPVSRNYEGKQVLDVTDKGAPVTNSYMTRHAFVKAYLDMCELSQTGQPEFTQSMLIHFATVESHFVDLTIEQRESVFEELVRQIEEKTYLFCTFCDRFMFTARQTFMHMACPEHIEKANNSSGHFVNVNNLMRMIVGPWRVDK
ncbi:hypothetical protein PMAYCL1PPCAC_01265, partial [Pristionchus mayeri]